MHELQENLISVINNDVFVHLKEQGCYPNKYERIGLTTVVRNRVNILCRTTDVDDFVRKCTECILNIVEDYIKSKEQLSNMRDSTST